jgi:quercetin dioxygenase-like cupin family protein
MLLTLFTAASLRAQAPLASKVFPADSAKHRTANQRYFVDTLTATLAKLEMHETVLKPGMLSHAPHRHAHEEVVVIQAGQLDLFLGGKVSRAKAGDIVFLASNEWHAMRNAGTTESKYLVVRMDARNLVPDAQPYMMPSPPDGWRQP